MIFNLGGAIGSFISLGLKCVLRILGTVCADLAPFSDPTCFHHHPPPLFPSPVLPVPFYPSLLVYAFHLYSSSRLLPIPTHHYQTYLAFVRPPLATLAVPHSSTRSLRSRDSFNRTKAGTVSDATYIAYMVIMLVGWVACLGLIPSHLVRRSDGSHAAPHPREVGDQLSWWQKFSRVAVREARHIYALKDEWRIWVGLPFSHFFRSHTDKGRS